ncbi:siderophore biosynthesis protein [Alcanivorax hongdengensis A-11-3]|uniref:Enterobactin synthase component D n=1 Tax=Alcanivorax hongdengensis A-11-3 TaxID=1177179 RepID=L0WCY9_9GAMM|nr:4'-phosphopantetheinyl transferase superfamily protein [Alcanivorax hongdengensis]EKF74613.1 siderophore biosynthesis protein [Alcanivorax hongdengensis A-11-3]
MPDAQRPASLSNLHREEMAQGLLRISCRYQPERLLDDSFTRAGITLPASLAGAVAKRRCEYLAGRWCAREGLRSLGVDAVPEMSRSRAPVWPEGTLGSITHSHGIAEVMVADNRYWHAVGLDTEQWLSVERANRLRRELLTPAELEQLAGLTPIQRANRITLIFSAKESLFKALYPLTGKRFYFQDAERRDARSLTLLKTLSADWKKGMTLPFRWRERQQGVLSWIALPHP